jgi:hypothetical protein
MRVTDAEALKGPKARLQCRHSECFHRMRSKNIRMQPKASNSCNISPHDSSVVSVSKVDLPKDVEVRFLLVRIRYLLQVFYGPGRGQTEHQEALLRSCSQAADFTSSLAQWSQAP